MQTLNKKSNFLDKNVKPLVKFRHVDNNYRAAENTKHSCLLLAYNICFYFCHDFVVSNNCLSFRFKRVTPFNLHFSIWKISVCAAPVEEQSSAHQREMWANRLDGFFKPSLNSLAASTPSVCHITQSASKHLHILHITHVHVYIT